MIRYIFISLFCALSIANAYASDPTVAKAFKAHYQIIALENALYDFVSHNGRFPTTTEGLNALIEQPKDTPYWKGPYLAKKILPKDPWGESFSYLYVPATKERRFNLYSKGKNKIDERGNGDDISIYTEPMGYGDKDWTFLYFFLLVDFPIFLFCVIVIYAIRIIRKFFTQQGAPQRTA